MSFPPGQHRRKPQEKRRERGIAAPAAFCRRSNRMRRRPAHAFDDAESAYRHSTMQILCHVYTDPGNSRLRYCFSQGWENFSGFSRGRHISRISEMASEKMETLDAPPDWIQSSLRRIRSPTGYPTIPCATSNSALSRALPAAPLSVLCPRMTILKSNNEQGRTRPTIEAMPRSLSRSSRG